MFEQAEAEIDAATLKPVSSARRFKKALLCMARGQVVRGFTRRRQLALAAFLIAFGISDLWELASGWSQPAVLFAFKAVCLAGLAITAGRIYRTRWTTV